MAEQRMVEGSRDTCVPRGDFGDPEPAMRSSVDTGRQAGRRQVRSGMAALLGAGAFLLVLVRAEVRRYVCSSRSRAERSVNDNGKSLDQPRRSACRRRWYQESAREREKGKADMGASSRHGHSVRKLSRPVDGPIQRSSGGDSVWRRGRPDSARGGACHLFSDLQAGFR